MTVRPATIDDADSIASVHIRSWQAAYSEILPAEFLAGLSYERRRLRWRENLIAGDTSTLVVETPEGEVVGFASVGSGAEVGLGELYAIYLEPRLWGTGLGRRLMAATDELLLQSGFSAATLWVFADNLRARRFYEAAGWTHDGGVRLEDIGGVQPQQMRYRRHFGQDNHPS
ncbi:MAG TPA: GNAT family N-acetyltransferase [Acidimicrobiia bacterium]|nr:GNAT family N-acetyltransferase [Acidimicrobiia bacterium]